MDKFKANRHAVIYFLFSTFLILITFQNCADDIGFNSANKAGPSANAVTETFTVGGDDSNSSSSTGTDGESTDDGLGNTPTGINHPASGNAGRPVTNVSYCDDPAFAGMQLVGECLALFDTFDRDVVAGAGQFNWLQAIDDTGRHDGMNVQANIFTTGQYEIGQSLHEEHAVYITGRKGGSVHEVFLVSQPLNLSHFDEMKIEFNYLPVSLEYASYGGVSGWEHVRLDICTSTQEECVGPVNPQTEAEKDLSETALKSNHWKSIWVQPGFSVTQPMDSAQAGSANTGRNHLQADWLLAAATVDLGRADLVPDKSKVIFRITVFLDEGFSKTNGNSFNSPPDFGSALDDAVGLDYVKVFAIQEQL